MAGKRTVKWQVFRDTENMETLVQNGKHEIFQKAACLQNKLNLSLFTEYYNSIRAVILIIKNCKLIKLTLTFNKNIIVFLSIRYM